MNKKFEYVDDNPGAYFSMLVEGFEDKEESLKEDYVTDLVAEILGKKFPMNKRNIKWLSNNGTSGEVEYKGQKFAFRKLPNGEYKVMRSSDAGWNWSETLFKDESLKEDYYDKRLVQKLYDMWFSKEQAEWLAKNAKDYAESLAYGHTTTDDLIEAEEYVNSKMKKQEAIKEDKFVPQDKMSKKAQKELNDKKRGTWGNTNPVTRVQPNKKAYDRKRDKKAIEESKKLKESIELDNKTIREIESGLYSIVQEYFYSPRYNSYDGIKISSYSDGIYNARPYSRSFGNSPEPTMNKDSQKLNEFRSTVRKYLKSFGASGVQFYTHNNKIHTGYMTGSDVTQVIILNRIEFWF